MTSFRRRAAACALAAAAVTAMAGCTTARPTAPATPPAATQSPAAMAGATPAPTTPAPTTPAPTVPAPTAPPRLPSVTGDDVSALWQARTSDQVFDGGTLLGVDGAAVAAISAATGAPRWTVTMPGPRSRIVGLVPAGGAVIVESAREIGTAPAALFWVVSEYTALSVASGRMLWTLPVAGRFQDPPIAASGQYLLTGDTSGAVTARIAATGAVAWRDPRPAACGPAPAGGSDNAGLGLAADGPLAGVSFHCGQRVVVQRLDPATGMALWTWTSPAVPAGDVAQLALTDAASEGGMLLLAGEIATPPAAQRFTGSLPRAYQWPPALGPADQTSALLALDAATGHPLWSELGGQDETVGAAAGDLCEMVSGGLECRDDTTGATTMPTLLTGMNETAVPPYGGDGFAAVSGNLAAVTLPSRHGVTLRVVRVDGGEVVAQASLAIGTTAYGGANYQVFAVAAAPLGHGALLVLLRRVDLPGYPLLALRVLVR